MTRADRDRRAISRGSPRIAYCPSHAIEVVEIHTQTSTVMSDYRRILWSTLAPETEVGMPKRSNEFQRLVAMLTALSSEGATVHESVEVMEIASKASREVDVVGGWDGRRSGRVSQRAKAVVLVDVVALVALDLATPPAWSDPGGPALELHLARRMNCRRGGNDLRDNATGTSDG
ncbi:MAG: hypothetical protein QOI79_32 [Mycobacterium sp.]|nr:hypothetical protein [Mycobacterium sp.]